MRIFLPLIFFLSGCLEPALDMTQGSNELDHDIDGAVSDVRVPDATVFPDANGRSDADLPDVATGPENPHPDGRDPDMGITTRADVGREDTGLDENGRPL
jgi:hypothetical protein